MARKARSKKGKPARKGRAIAGAGQLVPDMSAPVIRTRRGVFDLDDPVLPEWLEKAALGSGGYPYDATMPRRRIRRHAGAPAGRTGQAAAPRQRQRHADRRPVRGSRRRRQGRQHLRHPPVHEPAHGAHRGAAEAERAERGQWYFQRYAEHLPTSGEIVLFDRSWYNRGGVEPVMGFCTAAECRQFLLQAPVFETMLAEAGIVLFKVWLDIGREMQLKQFHQRRHDPLKIWKLSPVDYTAMQKWDAYTKARDTMMAATDTKASPWIAVLPTTSAGRGWRSSADPVGDRLSGQGCAAGRAARPGYPRRPRNSSSSDGPLTDA
jgi:polyphosphate kinase